MCKPNIKKKISECLLASADKENCHLALPGPPAPHIFSVVEDICAKHEDVRADWILSLTSPSSPWSKQPVVHFLFL